MKFILAFIIFTLICSDTPQSEETVDLKIMVTNITSLQGTIELGIFNDSENFLQKGKEYRTYSLKAKHDTVYFLIKDLKKDNYAVSIYHDVNSDSVCNLSFFGIPKEPYGFSKNYKPILSKPSFNNCKINAYQDMSIGIELLQ